MDKLTTSDKLIFVGGIVYLIAMFMPWWGIDTDFGDASNNGWDYLLGGWLPLVLIAVLAAHVGVTRFSPDTKIPDLPIPWSQGYLVAGILAAIIVVLRLIVPADESRGGLLRRPRPDVRDVHRHDRGHLRRRRQRDEVEGRRHRAGRERRHRLRPVLKLPWPVRVSSPDLRGSAPRCTPRPTVRVDLVGVDRPKASASTMNSARNPMPIQPSTMPAIAMPLPV